MIIRISQNDLMLKAEIYDQNSENFRDMTRIEKQMLKDLCFTLPPVGTYEITIGIDKACYTDKYRFFANSSFVQFMDHIPNLSCEKTSGLITCPSREDLRELAVNNSTGWAFIVTDIQPYFETDYKTFQSTEGAK